MSSLEENKAKLDMSAWRKRRSIVDPNNPFMMRKISRGEAGSVDRQPCGQEWHETLV